MKSFQLLKNIPIILLLLSPLTAAETKTAAECDQFNYTCIEQCEKSENVSGECFETCEKAYVFCLSTAEET